MNRLLLIAILAAAMLAAGCADETVRSVYHPPLMSITVMDTAGNPVPGLRVGRINHSDYITRPALPPLALPATQIDFSLQTSDSVWLTIHDYYDQLVTTLIDGEVLSAGTHTVEWHNDTLISGFYYYHIVVGNFIDDRWTLLDRGWEPASTIIGITDAEGRFVSRDTLVFPCLLGDPPTVEISDHLGNVIDSTENFYNDTITIHLSDPAVPDSFYFYDRAVQAAPNDIELIWEH